MAKYYVSDGLYKFIVIADNPVHACKKMSYYFNSIIVGGHYYVSEQGFDAMASGNYHIISSDDIQ